MTGGRGPGRDGGGRGSRRWFGPGFVAVLIVIGVALLWPRGSATSPDAGPGGPSSSIAPDSSTAVADGSALPGSDASADPADPADPSASAGPPPKPRHEVYGFVPYWQMDADMANHLADTDLSTVALFSVTHDRKGAMATGQRGYQRITSDLGRTLVRQAHERKTRVDVTYTSFGAIKNQRFYADPAAQDAWIKHLVEFVGANDFDGVNVDVESIRLEDVPAYGLFVGRLRDALRAQDPKAQVSVSTTSGPKGAAMAVAASEAGADRIFLMGYDYHYEGSEPGASSPLESIDGSSRGLRNSLDLFTAAGVPMDRVLLGLPLYGVTWPVVGPELGALSTGTGNEWIPSLNRRVLDAPGFKPTYDPIQGVEFYSVEKPAEPGTGAGGASPSPGATQWHAVYYDSPRSLTPKLALADERGLAGAGFWAIGFERGLPGYGELIHTFREGKVRAPG